MKFHEQLERYFRGAKRQGGFDRKRSARASGLDRRFSSRADRAWRVRIDTGILFYMGTPPRLDAATNCSMDRAAVQKRGRTMIAVQWLVGHGIRFLGRQNRSGPVLGFVLSRSAILANPSFALDGTGVGIIEHRKNLTLGKNAAES